MTADPRAPFRIVMLTNGSKHGTNILRGLHARRVSIHGVVFQGHGATQRQAAGGSHSWRYRLREVRAEYRRVRDWWAARAAAARCAARVVVSGPLNSEQLRGDLETLGPDFLILGGIGILKPHILQVSRIGTINTHPGLLPWARGSGVVGRAIERGVPVGATCHYVDPRIDTGAIIERRLVPLTGSERNLRDVELAADRVAVDMMVDIVVEQIAQGSVPVGTEQMERFPLCSWMSPQERRVADGWIQESRASQLLQEWRQRCSGDRLILNPAEPEAAQ